MRVVTEDAGRPAPGAASPVHGSYSAPTCGQTAAMREGVQGCRGSLLSPCCFPFPPSLPPSLLPFSWSVCVQHLPWLLLRFLSSTPLYNLVAFIPAPVTGRLTAAVAAPNWSPGVILVHANPSCVF